MYCLLNDTFSINLTVNIQCVILEDGYSLTLEEVGLYFDVTRERIRQIEAKALRRLRHPKRANGLRDYIET